MSDEGSKVSKISHDWANLTEGCLLNVFSKLTVKEMKHPLLVCKPWTKAAGYIIYNGRFVSGTRRIAYSPDEGIDWENIDNEVDVRLIAFVNKSEGGMKSIKITSCTDRSIFHVAEKCPDLELLSLSSCQNVTNESMKKIASNCKKLKELHIQECGQITEESLKMVKQNCPDVKIL